MATVFLADDPKHRRKVALKVLDPELAEALGADRFLREIEIAANLSHPHILPLFDSGEADGLLYYVMPFVEGESLRSRLDREKQLPVADAVAITAVGVSLGLAVAVIAAGRVGPLLFGTSARDPQVLIGAVAVLLAVALAAGAIPAWAAAKVDPMGALRTD
jgi:serine/threonine-protein kinase